MTEINLLPSTLRDRQRARRRTGGIAAAFVVIVLLLAGAYLYENSRLTSENRKLDAQNALNARLEGEIGRLQRFEQLKSSVDAKQVLVTQLVTGEVLWSGVLHDLSMIIPSQVYLTQFSGTVTTQSGSSDTAVSPNGLVGSLTFGGVALTYPDVSQWLTRLEEPTGWRNAWVSSGTKDPSLGITFNGTVDLTSQATKTGSAP